MSETTAPVDLDRLLAEVQAKYREVADDTFTCATGRQGPPVRHPGLPHPGQRRAP